MVENRRIYLDEDTRLMLKVVNGDHTAYVILYKKHLLIVTSYLLSLNAHKTLVKDLAQEVFCRIWEKREEYRPAATFKTFLFTYAKNVLLENQKKLTKEVAIIRRFASEYHRNPSGVPNNPEFKAHRTELLKNTKQAIMFFYVTGIQSQSVPNMQNVRLKHSRGVYTVLANDII